MEQNTKLSSYITTLVCEYKFFILALAIIEIAGSLLGVSVNYKVKEIIDSIQANPHHNIGRLLILYTVYTLMHHLVYFAARLFEIKYKPILRTEIVTHVYTKTIHHSLHWFDSHLSSEISSKINDFQDSMITATSYISRTFGRLFSIIISIAFIISLNILSSIVLLVFILIYSAVIGVLLNKQLYLQGEYVKARQHANGIMNDSIINIFGIKIIGSLWSELKSKLTPALNKWRAWDIKNKEFDAYYVDIADTIMITTVSVVQIYLLAYLFKNDQITAGDFAFILMVGLNIYRNLSEFLEDILFNLNPKIATIRSSYNFISDKIDVIDKPKAVVLTRARGEIKYENAAFAYGDGQNIFTNLNLHIQAGQRIGIVGSSGAGTSTFIKCLLRYFDLNGGKILVDGFDITDVTQESLWANISIIPQDITMLHRTIFENLQLAKYDATITEIEDACKKARIHNDILQMPNCYQTIVGEHGVKLSGGQRQRIAIARAILKNAPILILDEATSALDTPTEKLIQASLNEMFEDSNSTTIVIAHRLSTLLHMDRMFVFD